MVVVPAAGGAPAVLRREEPSSSEEEEEEVASPPSLVFLRASVRRGREGKGEGGERERGDVSIESGWDKTRTCPSWRRQ